MADYFVGAAACFNVRSPLLLALGSLENHGVGTNRMTLGPTAITDFAAIWNDNHCTKGTAPAASGVEAVDRLNTAGAAYWYTRTMPPS